MTTAEIFKKYHVGEAVEHVLYVPQNIDHVDEDMDLSLRRVASYLDGLLGHQNLAKMTSSKEQH